MSRLAKCLANSMSSVGAVILDAEQKYFKIRCQSSLVKSQLT
jgi:hypothetical protein